MQLTPEPLGLGLGLRNLHFDEILSERPQIGWFEAISENFMDSGGRPRAMLRRIAEHYPIVLHGVSLSIGSTDPLNRGYLARLKRLADEVQARWVSDHLCWTGVLGINSHDLLPLPLNEASLAHVITRVHQVQDALDRPLILENPSSYVRFAQSTLDEPAFFRALSQATGCGLLLDVNNVYVSCFNARSDPQAYLDAFPLERVVQLHLAGHQHHGTHIIDTHDGAVCADVWNLFAHVWDRTGGIATLLEWDDHIPSLATCVAELRKAEAYMEKHPTPAATLSTATASDLRSPAQALAGSDVSNPVSFLVPRVMDAVAADAI